MNTRIEKDFFFQCGVHFKNEYYINNYDIVLSFLVETDSMHEQNIAMERVVHYVTNVLQNAVLVESTQEDTINLYKAAKMKICELPQEPYDQIFGMVLLLKLNSIMEGRMKITDMIMGSMLSDGVRYSIVAEVAESALSGKHWWNRSNICLSDNDLKCPNGDNILKLFSDNKWSDLDLQWKEKLKK